MLREFFKFELDTQLRQPLLWVCALVFGALAFGASTTDAVQVGGNIGNVNRNAPVVVAQLLGAFSLMSMFVVTIFISGTVLRDSDVGIADMLFATPMKKHDYLAGRFGAGLVACLFIFVPIAAASISMASTSSRTRKACCASSATCPRTSASTRKSAPRSC